jgi:hypothetical protein
MTAPNAAAPSSGVLTDSGAYWIHDQFSDAISSPSESACPAGAAALRSNSLRSTSASALPIGSSVRWLVSEVCWPVPIFTFATPKTRCTGSLTRSTVRTRSLGTDRCLCRTQEYRTSTRSSVTR